MFNRSNFETHVYLTAFLVLSNGIILNFWVICFGWPMQFAWSELKRNPVSTKASTLCKWKETGEWKGPFTILLADGFGLLYFHHMHLNVSCNQWRLFALIQSKTIVFLAKCWCRLHPNQSTQNISLWQMASVLHQSLQCWNKVREGKRFVLTRMTYQNNAVFCLLRLGAKISNPISRVSNATQFLLWFGNNNKNARNSIAFQPESEVKSKLNHCHVVYSGGDIQFHDCRARARFFHKQQCDVCKLRTTSWKWIKTVIGDWEV